MFHPQNDGYDHINVYSRGATKLGRFLSNFAQCDLETEDGKFNSVEGYWYWLGTEHPDKDKLRQLHGFEAKKVGRELRGQDWVGGIEFQTKILTAIKYKVDQNYEMKVLLKCNKLPLAHYYVTRGKVIPVVNGQWILDGIEGIKKQLNILLFY